MTIWREYGEVCNSAARAPAPRRRRLASASRTWRVFRCSAPQQRHFGTLTQLLPTAAEQPFLRGWRSAAGALDGEALRAENCTVNTRKPPPPRRPRIQFPPDLEDLARALVLTPTPPTYEEPAFLDDLPDGAPLPTHINVGRQRGRAAGGSVDLEIPKHLQHLAARVLGLDVSNRWWYAPAFGLGWRKPIDVLAQLGGAELIEGLLQRIEAGVYT